MRDYLARSEERRPPGATDGSEEPFWLLVPGWLERRYASGGAAADAPGGFLSDALWAQWCLFLSLRIQDDLLDGDARRPELVLVASLLRLESERAFAAHLGEDARFWKLFRSYQEGTYHAAADIDRLQRSAGGIGPDDLDLYARASAIFKVGAVAVCLRRDAARDLGQVDRFCDHFAIAGQIVDDLLDVEEDLARGRRNYAACCMLRAREEPRDGASRQAVWRSFLLGAGAATVRREVTRELDAARGALARLALPAAEAWLDRFAASCDSMFSALHELRVERVLGELRSGAG